MDENKRKMLQEMKYAVRRVCGNCHFAKMSPDGWGTCTRAQYVHAKHTGAARDLSINRYGFCDGHRYGDAFMNTIGKFDEFKEK